MVKKNNQERFHFLRSTYPEFTYASYKYTFQGNTLLLDYEFKLNDQLIFKPHSEIIFPHIPQLTGNNAQIADHLVFHIGLIELISYWKATCSPKVTINAGTLNNEQVDYFKNLYYNGLGEFFYLNSIKTDQQSFMQINTCGKAFQPIVLPDLKNEYLVPIGGGKDSAVTLELLINEGYHVHPVVMNPRGATLETVKVAGINQNEIIVINRSIDPLLLDLNNQQYLNGHTPFSAMLAFYTLLVSSVSGHKHIALSNESSANEATIPGTGINHQYSKSFDFESTFRKYYQKYICRDLNYFSFLRPLNELQIMQIFSGLTKYHPIFRSCNAGSKTNEWCGNCPKCLFTHIMLAAYNGVDYANQIIGTNMLENTSNTQYFDELTGISEIKPFDCVGTLYDVQTAMHMIIDNCEQNKMPLLALRFKEKYQKSKSSAGAYPSDNVIPENFLSNQQFNILQKALENK